MERLGGTRACENHDHDLIHELSRRLDCVWRYDQYIANADWRVEIKQFWEQVKDQDEKNICRLKELIREEIHHDCF
jgi:hypothetical protein